MTFYPTPMTPEQAEAISPAREPIHVEAADDERWNPFAGLAFAILLSIAAFWLPAYIVGRELARALGWLP